MLGLNFLDPCCGVGKRFVPAHHFPRVGDAVANHGGGDAVLVGGVAPGKTPLHAGVAFVGFTVFPRHHAHHGVAFHFGLKAAPHTAIRAGGDEAVLGLAQLNDGLFLQGGGRACLDASAARHAFAVHKRLVLTGRHPAFKAAARNGQGKGALGFLASAHTAVAHNAFAGVVSEVGVGLILGQIAMVGASGLPHAVAHIAQAHHTGLGLQFAIAVGAAG